MVAGARGGYGDRAVEASKLSPRGGGGQHPWDFDICFVGVRGEEVAVEKLDLGMAKQLSRGVALGPYQQTVKVGSTSSSSTLHQLSQDLLLLLLLLEEKAGTGVGS